MENIHHYKTARRLGKDIVSSDDLDDINADHSYIGAQYLYLRDKLQKNAQFTNLRKIKYKEEKIKRYEYTYNILFIIYWILFSIYGIFFIYKGLYKNITNIIIIILMGGFPFYIHDLSLLLIKGLKTLYKIMKEFNLNIPNFKAEETVKDIENSIKNKSSVIRKPDKSKLTNNKNKNKKSNQKVLDNLLKKDANLKNLRINKRNVEKEAVILDKDGADWVDGGRWPKSAEKICKKTDDSSFQEEWDDLLSYCNDYTKYRDAYWDAYPDYSGKFYWTNDSGKWKKKPLK
jgi:organic radical activating enzyme|tara:strand:- start:544 stop:1407 length:864 start_codon:yes stop_codon:yes gene_type:complete